MVSVVIPAFNEQGAIEKTILELKSVLRNANIDDFEIIVVDDGSTDDTGILAARADVRVIKHPHNLGYGKSLKTGIINADYDTIVITDADGTYPINQLPLLLQKYHDGFDMVVGQRTGANYRESPLKWPLRILLKFLVEWTAGRKIPDINSGMRVFSKASVIPYFATLCDTFSFTTSLTLSYMMTSKFVEYLPIAYSPRIGRSHVKLWRDSLRTLQFILQAIVYHNPLKLFLLISIVSLLIGLLSTVIGIYFGIHSGFLMGIASIFCSILTFCIGLLAELLKQIMIQTNEK